MGTKNNDLSAIIEKGLKIMFSRLVEKAIKEDRELIIADMNGKPISVKATKFQHLVQ